MAKTTIEQRTLVIPETLVQSFTWSASKDSATRKGQITFDLSELTAQDILDYAIDSLVIKHQGSLRRLHGTEKWEEPKKDESGTEIHAVVATAPGTRKNANPEKKAVTDTAKKLLAMNDEQLDSLVALGVLTADDVAAVKKLRPTPPTV